MRIGVIYNLVDTVTTGLEQDAVSDNEVADTLEHVINALEPEHEAVPLQVRRDNLSLLTQKNFDFVFNLAEGFGRNSFGESWIASYLELQDIPYTGSNPFTLALCLDKAKAKAILRAHNLPTPNYQVFKSGSEKNSGLEFPLIVKPVHEDASIGITSKSVVMNEGDLRKQVDFVLSTYNQDALVEEFIDGREVNVSIIGNRNPTVLPVCELMFNFEDMPRIASFDAKWVNDSMQHELTSRLCPADLSSPLESRIKQLAVEAFKALDCKDYARIDFRVNENEPFILEVNPNPGINTDTSFFKSASTIGMSYEEMIQAILREAIARYPEHKESKRFTYNGEKLMLSRVRKQDLPVLMKWFNDKKLCKFMGDPESAYTLERLTEDVLLDQKNLNLSAFSSDKIVGYGSVYNIGENSADISFLIGREYQHNGYGRELVKGLVNIAFDYLNLDRLNASVTLANRASLLLCNSMGFSILGVKRKYHRVDGVDYDEAILELRRG